MTRNVMKFGLLLLPWTRGRGFRCQMLYRACHLNDLNSYCSQSAKIMDTGIGFEDVVLIYSTSGDRKVYKTNLFVTS